MNCYTQRDIVAKRLDEAQLFTKHFGSFSKADFETLLFSIYLDMLDKPVRDYDISVELGITESKVRSLRIKSQLLYPRQLLWEEELKKALSKGHFNENDCSISIMI